MNFDQLHFSHPYWLWAGVALPVIWVLFFLYRRTGRRSGPLPEQFIDPRLLPYLLIDRPGTKRSRLPSLCLWSLVWLCLTLSLAGPRWDFREAEIFSDNKSLVILLDLSDSMNARDVKPSRLIRAKQKIEDILNAFTEMKIGLVAFAADPHMLVPLTEDKETIRRLLSHVDTDLMYIQGSRLSPALEMAGVMLKVEPGNNKAILIIGDGGFDDASAIVTGKKLTDEGIFTHTMGIGTSEGAPVPGKSAFSKLEKEKLEAVAISGKGIYLDPTPSSDTERILAAEFEKHAESPLLTEKKKKFWNERFYLLLLPVLPAFLLWWRRGMVFSLFFICFIPDLNALELDPYFKNSEELGKQAFDSGDYETAADAFRDAYRKGVACYKADRFDEAEHYFRASTRSDVAPGARYNLGNALARQQKWEEAIAAYEEVLTLRPDHADAKANLAIIKKILEEQKQQTSSSKNSDDKNKEGDSSHNESDNKQNSKNSEANDEEQSKSGDTEQDPNSKNSDEKQESRLEKDQNKSGDNKTNANRDSDESFLNSEENKRDLREEENSGEPGNNQKKEHPALEKTSSESPDNTNRKPIKSQEDHDADLWLNRMSGDPKVFLKNKCYIESKKNGTKEGINPW